MAWEWVGPVSTGVVGVVGMAATVLTHRQGREHTLILATHAREQDRKQGAYERILRSAIETTEFVGYADVIWRHAAEPPDVDYKNYDLWMMVDLYASVAVHSRYNQWSDSVAACRAILDGIPEDKAWHEMDDALQGRFRAAKRTMDAGLRDLIDEARRDLSGREL